MDRFNLFQFADEERSHTAFWAWVMQATDAENEELKAPKDVGESAIRLLDGPIPPGSVDVTTDPALQTTDRPNLRIDFGDDHSLFVELKKESRFSASQIESYRAAIDDDDRIALISTQFDAEEAVDVCPSLTLDDIRELLWPVRTDHPLLSDYADWADARKEHLDAIERNAFAEEAEAIASALSTLYGQRLVMDAVGESLGGQIQQGYSSRSGDPYTNFRFAEAGADQDTLFYQIDEYAAGHHISLKQFLPSKDAAAWNGKEERLDQLREWWTDVAEEIDHRLTFRSPHNNGSKTREVACLLFKQNPPSVVADDLPDIHDAFTTVLDENGWDLR